MKENLALLIFSILPLLAAGFSIYFFKWARETGKTKRVGIVVIGNVMVLLFLVTLALPIGECYFRFIYDSTDALDSTKVSEQWFRRHYRSNNAGCRDNIDYGPKIVPGRRRITFLGDSFTAGHGIKDIKERFANIIADRHPEWEIHVLARPGFDTGNELKSLQVSLDAGYELNEVVLVYCLNDISDILPDSMKAIDQIYAVVDSAGWWCKSSYLVNTLFYRLKILRMPNLSKYFDLLEKGYAGPMWPEQENRLKEMRDMVSTHGGKLSVVTFPFFDSHEKEYRFGPVHTQLGKLWKKLEVPHLDLLSKYETIPASKLVVNRYDSHPNEFANKLAAEAIDPFLTAQMSNLKTAKE